MQTLQRSRPLRSGCEACATLLQASGQWDCWRAMPPATSCSTALRLNLHERATLQQSLVSAVRASRRLDLAEFTAWVNDALEAASFVPPHPQQAATSRW